VFAALVATYEDFCCGFVSNYKALEFRYRCSRVIGGALDVVRVGGTLVLDAEGNIYGTAVFGGTLNQGTIFEITP
jgi:uncharacterized repeat protein (TIGR03803 family)